MDKSDNSESSRNHQVLNRMVNTSLLLMMVFLGILFIANIVVLGNYDAAIKMHWDLSPAAGDLLVTGKVLVCFITGVLYLVAAAGIIRHRFALVRAGLAGSALFFGYYLVELVSWGSSYPPVWIGFFSFGFLTLVIGIYSAWKWRSGRIIKRNEILPGVHQVPGVQGNCYLLERDGLCLIDSGMPRSTTKILSYIRNTLKKDPRELQYIILTHYHLDHIGSAAPLSEITGAKIAIHEADTGYLTGKKNPPPLKGVRGKILGFLMIFWPIQVTEPHILLHDGDQICGMQCIHTPGHTPGSICLYDSALSLFFVGDAFTSRKGNIGSPPASATHDPAEAFISGKKISRFDFDHLLSGHGLPVIGKAAEKVRNFYRDP